MAFSVRTIFMVSLSFITLLTASLLLFGVPTSAQSQNPQSGSVGLEGVVPGKAPTQAAVISFPRSGQVFDAIPITVTGICTGDVLVKLYKNEVFSGSAQCSGGNFSIITDLFSGRNDLVARVYDDLDQKGPDSNVVTVTYNDAAGVEGVRVSVTSSFSKRGGNPNSAFTWPFTISGGTGPYAVSIDWGDKTSADLLSRPFPGDFTAQHTYKEAGIYNIVIKVTDANGVTAFLQVVGIGYGPIAQTNANNDPANGGAATNNGQIKRIIIWWPLAIVIPMLVTTFWLGRRHQRLVIRRKLLRGDRPF